MMARSFKFTVTAGTWKKICLVFLRSLRNVDTETVRQFFDAIHKRFDGEYIIVLAQGRDGAIPVVLVASRTAVALCLSPKLELHDL